MAEDAVATPAGLQDQENAEKVRSLQDDGTGPKSQPDARTSTFMGPPFKEEEEEEEEEGEEEEEETRRG